MSDKIDIPLDIGKTRVSISKYGSLRPYNTNLILDP